VCERIAAPSADGTLVPVTVAHRRDVALDGQAPLFLQVYGAYGQNFEPSFSSERVSLLMRGWVLAIAHVRGGGDLGRAWYEGGRQMRKMNSFADLLAASRHLVNRGYSSPARLCLQVRCARVHVRVTTVWCRFLFFRRTRRAA
jgi:oligopeptidase B